MDGDRISAVGPDRELPLPLDLGCQSVILLPQRVRLTPCVIGGRVVRLQCCQQANLKQPRGQRPAELVAWALEILDRYGEEVGATCSGQPLTVMNAASATS